MSESSPPNPAPASPTPPAPAPKIKKITPLERVGTTLTIPAGLATVVVLGTLIFQSIAGSIELETIDQVRTFLTVATILSIAAVALGLFATVFNLPSLRVPTAGRSTSTVISGASLVGVGIFLFVSLLPRVNAVSNLSNTLAPFGESIKANCKTPLSAEVSRYQQIQKDAAAVPSIPTSATLSVFGLAMGSDATELQQDVKTLTTALTNLQALKAPESKYNALLKGCITDVQETLAFLNDATLSGISTALFVPGLQQSVPSYPASIIPTAEQATIIAIIGATGNFPTSYSAIGMLSAAAQFVTQNPSAPTIAIPPSIAAGLSATDQATIISLVILVGAAGFPTYVATVMQTAANAKDAKLTAEGDQLTQDIENILSNNLAPIKVDTTKIVNS